MTSNLSVLISDYVSLDTLAKDINEHLTKHIGSNNLSTSLPSSLSPKEILSTTILISDNGIIPSISIKDGIWALAENCRSFLHSNHRVHFRNTPEDYAHAFSHDGATSVNLMLRANRLMIVSAFYAIKE